MDFPYSTETIDGQQFCVWRAEEAKELEIGRETSFSWAVPLVLFVLLISIVVLLRLSLSNAVSNPGFSSALVYPIVLVIYGPMIVFSIIQYRKRRSQVFARPPEVPQGAIRVTATAASASSSFGLTEGWLWIEGPWLVFQGERFGVRLSHASFLGKLNSHLLTNKRPMVLRCESKKLSASITFTASGAILRDNLLLAQWKADVETWKLAAQPNIQDIYPPARYMPEDLNRPMPSVFRWFSINVVSALLCAIVIKFGLPQTSMADGRAMDPDSLAGVVALVVFGFISLIYPGAQFSNRANARKQNAKIDAYIAADKNYRRS